MRSGNEIPEDILREVDKIIDRELEGRSGMGLCHIAWQRKKDLLAERGYHWLSPKEENTNIIFD